MSEMNMYFLIKSHFFCEKGENLLKMIVKNVKGIAKRHLLNVCMIPLKLITRYNNLVRNQREKLSNQICWKFLPLTDVNRIHQLYSDNRKKNYLRNIEVNFRKDGIDRLVQEIDQSVGCVKRIAHVSMVI